MPTEPMVHVIDDDPAVRDSLAFLLGHAHPLDCARIRPRRFSPACRPNRGCIVTDVRMPEMNGIELLRRVTEQRAVPVIVITGHGDVPLAVEAMKLGAFDFLEKPFNDETILAAVGGARAFRSRRTGRVRTAPSSTRGIASLSSRERQVLDGLVAGHSNKLIARILNQPAHGRDLPRPRDDQDAGGQPLGARAHGDHRRTCGIGF